MFNVKSFLFCVKQIFSIAISLENTIHTHTHRSQWKQTHNSHFGHFEYEIGGVKRFSKFSKIKTQIKMKH